MSEQSAERAPLTVQVTVDSTSPHELADWWSDTLGWPVEPTDEAFIRSMVEAGHASEDETTTHRGSLVWKAGAAVSHPDSKQRLLFQWVPEDKAGKNRVHLDLRLPKEGPHTSVDELVARGATKLHDAQQGPYSWTTLTDPQGNEFCVG